MDTPILRRHCNPRQYIAGFYNLIYAVLLSSLLLVPGAISAGETLRIVSQNMNRLFDAVDDDNQGKVESKQRFQERVDLAADRVIKQFGLPDIIALQEVENLNVLDRISARINTRSGLQYQAVIRNGNDISGINLGFLIHPGVKVDSVRQLFAQDLLNYNKKPLFSRPPLLLRTCIESSCLSLLNLHLRSMRGLRKATQSRRVRLKRFAQARAIAQWVDHFQRSSPQESLMVLGDFNALTPPDSIFDLAGSIRGNPNNSNTEIAADDWIEDDLVDLAINVPDHKRYSYIFKKKKQILDYMLVNTRFKPRLRNIAFTPVDYKFSDHAGLIADFDW